MQAAAAAINASLSVGQTGVVEAANAAAFGSSNSSAIATANATATALAADNGTCTSYPAQSYASALSSVLDDNNTEAAAAGIAAGFAQGCCVSSATAVAVLDLIAIDGCTSIIGGILLSMFLTSAWHSESVLCKLDWFCVAICSLLIHIAVVSGQLQLTYQVWVDANLGFGVAVLTTPSNPPLHSSWLQRLQPNRVLQKLATISLDVTDRLVCLCTGAETIAGLNSTGYSNGAMGFTEATVQSVAIQRCLAQARTNSSTSAKAIATQARNALMAGNSTAAVEAIQAALCDPVTATATAEAFAEIITSNVGCNGTVQTALTSKILSLCKEGLLKVDTSIVLLIFMR